MVLRSRPTDRRGQLFRLSALVVAALVTAIPFGAWAQSKQVITFAGVTFSEAGRGDRLKAWVEKFNKSQNAIEVQPIAMPFATLAKTVFTQMGGGAGPDLVRFDLMDYYAAVASERILPLDDIIKTSDYKFAATDKYMTVGGKRYGIAFETSNYVLLYNPALLPGGKPPANFDEFVAAVALLLTRPDLLSSIRATARQYALSISWEPIFESMYKAYERHLQVGDLVGRELSRRSKALKPDHSR